MPVAIERRERVMVVTIDRPEVRNAVDGPTAAALKAAFDEFEADARCRVAVLAGSGGPFCAGAGLSAMATERSNQVDVDMAAPGPMGPTRMELSKPVIAAVEGYAVAGGLELAIWCDLRVAASNATFGVFCRRWGVPLIDGGTVRLPRLIGQGRALDLILTGRPVGAEEALAIGLVDRVVEPGEAVDAAVTLAGQIAALPQNCLQSDRASARRSFDLSHEEAMAYETAVGAALLRSPEIAEGVERFARGAGRHGT